MHHGNRVSVWVLSFVSAYSVERRHCGNKLVGEEAEKKLGGGENFFFLKKVDVIEVSVKEQNWNQRVAFKWKMASQSSLRERQHLQRFCCSLVLPLSQFLLSEPPPHAHYFCPIWVRIPAVPVCPRWHQWSFLWPMVHLIHNFIDQFTFMRLDVRCEHCSPCFQAKKIAPLDWGEGRRATSCGHKWQCHA